MRRLPLIVLALTVPSAFAGTTIPMRSVTAPDIASIRTFQGVFPAQSRPVHPPPGVLLVFAADTLSADDIDRLKPSLTALQQSSRAANPLRFGILAGRALTIAGPFATRVACSNALKELQASLTGSAASVSPNAFYSSLPAALQTAGSGWLSVVLVGHFPALDPALQNYASAYLNTAFLAQQVRISYLNFAAGSMDIVPVPLLDALARATSGRALTSTAGLLESEPNIESTEVSWTPAAFSRGFHVHTAELLSASGAVLSSISLVAAAAATALPDLDHYATLRASADSCRKLLASTAITAEETTQIRADLQSALLVNPRDADALRIAANFYERFHDPKTAAALLAQLTEIETHSGALLVELGHQQFLAQDLPAAEKSLMLAREWAADSPAVSEDLARIHVARDDGPGALPFIDESLAAQPANQDLWFTRADLAATLKDWPRQSESLEKALALSGDFTARRLGLIRLYLDHQQPAQAAAHLQKLLTPLPPDAATRATCASLLEELHRPEEALAVWRQTLEIAPASEPSHYAITRLLLSQNRANDALAAADIGIAAAPQSARLHIAKSAALVSLDRLYAARATLSQAARQSNDIALIEAAARMEDSFGASAVAAYSRLTEVLEKQPVSAAALTPILQRGLDVSLREGDSAKAAWFAQKLSGRAALTAASRKAPATAMVPGGIEALSFMAHGKTGSTPDRFLLDYCRGILGKHDSSDKKAFQASMGVIMDYFQKLGSLLEISERRGTQSVITLSITDKRAQKQTEKTLAILGWKVRGGKGKVTVESGEKASQAKRQEVASALNIDQIAMQEAFQAGKPFTIEIPWQPVPVLLDEATWRDRFYPKQHYLGGFAEAIARDPDLAKAYVGLSALDRETSAALVSGLGLKALADKFGDRLSLYSSALAISGNRPILPGGSAAAPVWSRLAGASADNAAPFLRALFEKDDGRLLAFFFSLSQLDPPHQRFFTLNAARTQKFYELFRESPDVQSGIGHQVRQGSFLEFLREVPIDADGSVDFPGSPEVWMVVKGQSSNVTRTNKLMKRVHKSAAPDVEDEILLRLARTHYKSSSVIHSELDNFISVVRIDEHRSADPEADALDEASALTLAQHSVEYAALYPYFSIFTRLGSREFEEMFAFAEKMRNQNALELNLALGQFQSALELLSLSTQSGAISQKRATDLFHLLCQGFDRAAGPADFTVASLAFVYQLTSSSAQPDRAIRTLLLGSPTPIAWESGGTIHQMDSAKLQLASFDRVVESQKVPALQPLFEIAAAARNLSVGKGSVAAQVQALDAAVARLPSVDVPKGLKMEGKSNNSVQSCRTDKLRETIARYRQKTSRNKVNLKDLEKLEHDLLTELEPQMRLALSGLVYARYFSPDDLVLSDDPLLLRKHQFIDLVMQMKVPSFPPSEFYGATTGGGSYLRGGFGTFSTAVGRAALAGSKKADDNVDAVLISQIGSLRNTDWGRFGDEEQHLAALKISVAREWCVMAARSPEIRASLASATLGLLSLTRRRDLLAALDSGEWSQLWRSVTLSDLYFLGDRYLAVYASDSPALPKLPWDSPVATALHAAARKNSGIKLQTLGAGLPTLYGCSHSHLANLAPYEEYERHMFPERMAERVSEFKLYLVEYLDRAGVPAGALRIIAEPLARRVLATVKMSDLRDWNSVLASYAKLNDDLLEDVLAKP